MEFDKTNQPRKDAGGSALSAFEAPLPAAAVIVEASEEDRLAAPLQTPGEHPVFEKALGVSFAALDRMKEANGGRLPDGPILIDTGINPFNRPQREGILRRVGRLLGLV